MSELSEAVIAFYQEGRNAAEIVKLVPQLSSEHKLGSARGTINQRLVNRWLRNAREEDPDLVIWHHLNRRRRKPGVYTNWTRGGFVILAPFYDPLTDTLYLGPGDTAMIPESGVPEHVITSEVKQNSSGHRSPKWRMRDSDAVGPYVAELHDAFGYSSRDIVKLWENKKTRHPATDGEPRVMWLAEQLRGVRLKAMGHTTVNRILKVYGYRSSNFESGAEGDK